MEEVLKTDNKTTLLDYGMIIGVCIVMFLFALFIRGHIIYTAIKEHYHGKAKALAKALRKT